MKNLLIIFAVLLLLLTLLSAFGGSISYKESFVDDQADATAYMYGGDDQIMASDPETEPFSQFGPVNTEAIGHLAHNAWVGSQNLLEDVKNSGKAAMSNLLPTIDKYKEANMGGVEPFEATTISGPAYVELF